MLRLYASATASVQPKDSPVAEQLELNRRTVVSYRDLLSAVHVIWDLPAFVPGNASGQVVKSPKLHIVDSGLAAALTGRDRRSALDRDPRFAGALVETMAANDLRVQATAHDHGPRLYHYREGTNEVDLVVEAGTGSVMGIEIKLASNPGNRDLNGLRRLRQSAGSRWAGGVVLCRVPVGRMTDDRLTVAPLEAIWQVR
jgi:predicted AAA+ superfamily ATPase